MEERTIFNLGQILEKYKVNDKASLLRALKDCKWFTEVIDDERRNIRLIRYENKIRHTANVDYKCFYDLYKLKI